MIKTVWLIFCWIDSNCCLDPLNEQSIGQKNTNNGFPLTSQAAGQFFSLSPLSSWSGAIYRNSLYDWTKNLPENPIACCSVNWKRRRLYAHFDSSLWDWTPNLDFIIKVDLTMEPTQINQAWMWWNFCFFVALNHCRFQGKFLPAATFNEKSLKRCGSIKGDKWIYLKDGSGILESLLNWSWFCNFVVDATIYFN